MFVFKKVVSLVNVSLFHFVHCQFYNCHSIIVPATVITATANMEQQLTGLMQSFHTRPHGIRHMIPCEHININYFGEHTLLKVWSRYVCDDHMLSTFLTTRLHSFSIKLEFEKKSLKKHFYMYFQFNRCYACILQLPDILHTAHEKVLSCSFQNLFKGISKSPR